LESWSVGGKSRQIFFKNGRELTILSSAYAKDGGLGHGRMRNYDKHFCKQ